MSTAKIDRASYLVQINADQKMAEGLKQHLSSLPSLPFGVQPLTPDQIAQILANRVAAAQAAQAASVARLAAIQANRELRAQSAPVVRGLRRIVQGLYGQSPDILATFGLAPPKVGKKTVDAKVNAVLKNKATRKARHTMGKRQKEAIRGTVEAPSTNPAAETTPASASAPTGSAIPRSP